MAYAREMVAMTAPAAAIAILLAIFLWWPSDGKSLPQINVPSEIFIGMGKSILPHRANITSWLNPSIA
jgi:hypothetical protein